MAQLDWESLLVPPEQAAGHLKPGMGIYLESGDAVPGTMVRYLMDPGGRHIDDLELVQVLSFGEAISPQALRAKHFRLKTFFMVAAPYPPCRAETMPATRISCCPSPIIPITSAYSSPSKRSLPKMESSTPMTAAV